jgi:hypothetical protein
MTMTRQGDLFAAASGSATPHASETPEPAAIRARLHAMLATVRSAREMPWEPARARAQGLLFNNMANWLPDAERDALRRAFAAEMNRLRGEPIAGP